MHIRYRNKRCQKLCEDAEEATKAYGDKTAKKLHQRIDELIAASSVDELLQFRIGRCHRLEGNRKGQYAMDLSHPLRLIFTKVNDESITVEIIGIIDYH